MKRLFLYTMAAAAVLSVCSCQEKPESGTLPEIKLSEEPLLLAADGGEADFSFAVESPAEGGEMKVSAPGADWLTGFAVVDDCLVKFAFEANDTGEERTAEILLTYEFGGGSVEAVKTVIQDAGEEGGEGEDEPWTGPVPDIVCPDIQVPAEGGAAAAFYYVNDAAEGGELSLSCEECAWVSDVRLEEPDRVTFNVEPNAGEKREFRFTLTYTYGSARQYKDELTVTVTQLAAASEGPDEEREMTHAAGTYNGTDKTYTNVHEYHIYTSNQPFEVPDEYASASASYDVDLYGAAPADPETMLPGAGTYEYGITYMMNTFSLYFRDIFGEWHSFNSGTLVLDYDDSGNMLLDITATDEEGDVHHVTFAGPVVFEDIRD